MYSDQFRIHIARPVLEKLDMWSPAAENLIVGTAAHETHFQFLDQITSRNDETLGPAYGIFQIEPATHDDVLRYLDSRPEIRIKVLNFLAPWPDHARQLVTNYGYATAIARIKYWMFPEPLPLADDIPGLAAYWKQFYNTPAGKGTVQQFIDDYERYG